METGRIEIHQCPTCTWELEGNTFQCTHDQVEVVRFVDDNFGPNGHYETYYNGYACLECGATVEGNPDEDEQEYIAEIKLMEALGK